MCAAANCFSHLQTCLAFIILQHVGMLHAAYTNSLHCRDNTQQELAHTLLLQNKADARAAIAGLADHQQKYRDVSRQIIRATADRQLLSIDRKQVSAELEIVVT